MGLISIDMISVVKPSFCYDSLIPSLCFSIFNFVEVVALIVIVYYVLIKKSVHESS